MVKFENLSEKAFRQGRVQEFFKVLSRELMDLNDIEVSIVEPTGSSLKRSSESEEILDKAWQRRISSGFKPWPNDTKPSRYRLASHEIVRQPDGKTKMRLTLDPCVSYRDFNASESEEFRTFINTQGAEGVHYEPNAVAVSTVIFCKDSGGDMHMLVTIRNEKQDYKPGGFHVSTGGFMQIDPNEKNPITAALRENQEESGIAADELSDIAVLGMTYNPQRPHPDLIFVADTTLTVEEIQQRVHDDENQLFFIPAERKKLQQWLLAYAHAAVAPALASIILAGKLIVAKKKDDAGMPIDSDVWEQEMLKALAWRFKDPTTPEGKELEQRDVARLTKNTGTEI